MNKSIFHGLLMQFCRFLSVSAMVLAASAVNAQAHTDHQATPLVDTDTSSATQAVHDHSLTAANPAGVESTSDDHSGHTSEEATMTMSAAMSMDMSNTAVSPAELRDPHAYSNGYQLGTGLYALDGPRLHLADEMRFGGFRMNRLEQLFQEGEDITVFDGQAWYGSSYNTLVVKVDGEIKDGSLEDSSVEAFWSHAVASFWDAQIGLSVDNGDGPTRNWIAAGFQGIAPYWFEIGVTAYVGEDSRTALNLEAEYDLLLTQKWLLQPRLEMNFYGKEDAARGIGSGLSDTSLGLRLHYLINQQLRPYIGIEKLRKYGKTADFGRSESGVSETSWIAGLRFWF